MPNMMRDTIISRPKEYSKKTFKKYKKREMLPYKSTTTTRIPQQETGAIKNTKPKPRGIYRYLDDRG